MYMKTKDEVKMSRKRPLSWLATLATLSPMVRAVDAVRSQNTKIVETN
jgi:hypothetical protein